MFWGFRPALPLTGGSDPGGLCLPIELCTLLSADHPVSALIMLTSTMSLI